MYFHFKFFYILIARILCTKNRIITIFYLVSRSYDKCIERRTQIQDNFFTFVFKLCHNDPVLYKSLEIFSFFLWKCVKVKRATMRISIRWVWGVDKQDSICIMEFLLYTINNNLMLSQNIPFHHKMIIYLNTKMFFLLFFYAYSEICCREDKESFILSATPYLLWPPCW